MAYKLPPELEEEIAEETVASLKRGQAVRRLDVLLPALVQAAAVAALALLGIRGDLAVVIIIVVANLCVIWAVMSVSASLNLQFDTLTKIIVYYAEKGRTDQRQR